MAEYDDFGAQVNPEFLGGQTINPVAEYLAKFWRKITPTQRTPGGLLAPSFPNTPVTPAELADATSGIGALPQALKPRVRSPQPGALPVGVPPSFGGGQESDVAMPLAAEPEVAQPAPAAPAVPAAPQNGLREQYMERLAAMAKGPASTGMTEQQKGMALLEASLAGMAAASKPGASLMGSIGQGGQVGMAAARETEKANRAQAERRRAEDVAALHTEMTLAGQDQTRADTKEERAERHKVDRERIAREEKRDTITDKRETRKIDLLKQKLEAGEVEVVKSDETGTLIILNKTTNDKKNTGIKFKREDGRPAAVQLLDALADNPKRKETYKEIYGEKGAVTERDAFSKAFELVKITATPGETPEEAMGRLKKFLPAVRKQMGVTGDEPPGPEKTISRKSETYKTLLKRPNINGDKARADAGLKENGYTVTD